MTGTRGADAVLVGFARALRAAGVAAHPERTHAFLRAVDVLGADVYRAGRATLCGSPADLERYDRVFAAYFGGGGRTGPKPAPAPPVRVRAVAREAPAARSVPGDARHRAPPALALAGWAEVLRHRDFAALDAAQREQLHRLLAAFAAGGPTR
ncbi:hypothetical protein AB0G32_40020, partial [Streptomyces sp. NPDC023723]